MRISPRPLIAWRRWLATPVTFATLAVLAACDPDAQGATQVKMFGQMIPVRARIEKLNDMSAHADAGEILRWLGTFPSAPRVTYLVHGEPTAQATLKARIERELGWTVHIPAHGEQVEVPL